MCYTDCWLAKDFPPVEPSEDHIVLFRICNGQYIPNIGEDKWDKDHVKMPCSDRNISKETNETKQWDVIVEALSRKIKNSEDLASAILTYQTQFKDIWKFKAMHRFFNEYWDKNDSEYFFENTLPKVARLALDLPELIKSPIPLLKQGCNISLSFTQLQLASLLANAFFCTFPERNNKRRDSEYKTYPPVNFNVLYDGGGPKVMEKLKFICHYFNRVCEVNPTGVVTFSRRHIPVDKCPDWARVTLPMSTVPLGVDDSKLIEDAKYWIQMDFANKYIGGGVLRRGAVQEEIRFVSNPELMVSLLFTEVLSPTEAVMIIGTERYSTHTGYSSTVKWSGNYIDETPTDSSARRQCAILALDARRFPKPDEQYCKEMIDRELNKAYVGFSFYSKAGGLSYPGIATGNWGCGAFGGSARLKSLLQIMACVRAGRPISYFTFNDVTLKNNIEHMYEFLRTNNVTVGDLYKCLMDFCESEDHISVFVNLYENIENYFNKQMSLDDNQPKT
ncbi:poly(ADP-ribose) glycohydrolase-like [Danaus plexippus]|uniref:poly(ADP-ribose) glycohydrolase-like n=1 Tax=Danaus plexippus TaxID=13037 RepID=UPI002AB0A6DD|nr:poly(ADP-ribose) glycohydrolase-like [Danaus plexippus]